MSLDQRLRSTFQAQLDAVERRQSELARQPRPILAESHRWRRPLLAGAVALVAAAAVVVGAVLFRDTGDSSMVETVDDDTVTSTAPTSTTGTSNPATSDPATSSPTTSATETSATVTSSTTTSSTDERTPATLADQPEITAHRVSPSWVAALGEDFEDIPSLITSVQSGGEAPQTSDSIIQILQTGVSGDIGLPYYYVGDIAETLIIAESLDTRLDNGDSLGVGWRYVWANTQPCQVCAESGLPWDNGWRVWTDADPGRGIIRMLADHPELPIEVEVVFYPDPLRWPEALPENDPILVTSPGEAEATAVAVLDTVAAIIPIPVP